MELEWATMRNHESGLLMESAVHILWEPSRSFTYRLWDLVIAGAANFFSQLCRTLSLISCILEVFKVTLVSLVGLRTTHLYNPILRLLYSKFLI